ncbi:MAG: MFS transporter, partial [Proteobacteria bacterium]
MSATTVEEASAPKDTSAEGHPRGLFTLFGAEAWERFSYYGMRALLVLYLTKNFKYGRAEALEMYGIYTGLVYLTPLLGGYIADKFLGRRKAVFIGGILMAMGQLALSVPALLHFALGLLIAGNGFFKPNISTMVGGLYREGDSRRDGAFTIFYMGINLGALFSPIVCGGLADRPDRVLPIGFLAAAAGMALGLWQFWHGQKHLGGTGLPPGRSTTLEEAEAGPYRSGPVPASDSGLRAKDYLDVLAWSAVTAGVVWGVLLAWKGIGPFWGALPGAVKLGALFVALGIVFVQLYRDTTPEQKQEVSVIII